MFHRLFLVIILAGLQAQANFCGTHFISPKVVLISGTDRPGSNTLKITRHIEELMKEKGQEVSLLNLAEMDKSELNGDYFNASDSFKKKFTSKLIEADAIIFVFPEYMGDMPGVLKMFIDYMDGAAFAGKPIGMIADADGMLGGQKGAETLSGIMRHRKADVIGESLVLIPGVSSKLKDDRIQDEALLQRIDNSVQALIKRASGKYELQMQIQSFLELAISVKQSVSIKLNSNTNAVGKIREIKKDERGILTSVILENGIDVQAGDIKSVNVMKEQSN